MLAFISILYLAKFATTNGTGLNFPKTICFFGEKMAAILNFRYKDGFLIGIKVIEMKNSASNPYN